MEGQERLIYLWDGAEWVKALGDGAGHFQVDILTAPALVNHIYGYDGAAWQTILVESAANPNLRARLYDAANPITSGLFSAIDIDPDTMRGLDTRNLLYLYYNADHVFALNSASARGDADSAISTLPTALWGFNDATWDRLRTYLTGILKVARAETDAITVRVTAAGGVVAGDHYLYWIACSPDAANAEWQLTDAIGGGGAIVYDHYDPDRHSEHLIFDPPMHFTTGIWIEKFDHMFSLVFCYR